MIRYAITEEGFGVNNPEPDLGLLKEKADFVLLRAKQIDAGAMTLLARRMVRELTGAKVLVSGRADVALAAGAAGVHLSARHGELTPEQVRRAIGPAVVSVSCHTLEEVARARDAGADLILFAPVFEKRVAGEMVVEGVGLEGLRRACEVAGKVRVIALGGVTWAAAEACVGVGAAGVAGIRLFGGSV